MSGAVPRLRQAQHEDSLALSLSKGDDHQTLALGLSKGDHRAQSPLVRL